jgi:squalene-associated FAD-dependent desaturase
MTTTHIIGGGLAGLAAALDLTKAGQKVTIYEAGPACGGRCRSYFDRELGCRIDNGNHLLLSGNRAAMRFLDAIGTRHTLGGPGSPCFPFMDLATGQRWTLRPNAGLLPWWVFVPSRGVPGARLADYLGLLRLRFAAADATVGGLLPHNALYTNLIEPLAISALNTPAAQGSARLFWAIIAESLARGGEHCVPLFPREGLSESFVDPAVARITEAGGEVHTTHRISALTIERERIAGLAGPDGPIRVAEGDHVVLAVPPAVAATLLPGLSAPDEHEAILNLHYRWQQEPTEAGFVGLVGGLAEWVFIKPGVVSVTVSAANRLADDAPESLASTIWHEVGKALGIVAKMPQWRLIREKRATFAATPAQQLRRPIATTHLHNLVLAGDWTDTGLPATIEGAIRSGFAAAQHVTISQLSTK